NLFALDPKPAWVTGIPGNFYLDGGKWRKMDNGGEDQYGDSFVRALNLAIGGPDEEPACVFFLDEQEGWISNFNGYVAKSTDGGRTWKDLCKFDGGSGILWYFWQMYFADSSRGWALSSQGNLYGTSDGGISWSKLTADVHIGAMFFLRP